MRLINADDWKKYFYDHFDDQHMEIAKIALDEMPTIEAIPIEWLNELQSKFCTIMLGFVDMESKWFSSNMVVAINRIKRAWKSANEEAEEE